MNLKPEIFRSNGKLLLTAEYLVLDGAKALALPTKYGQSLAVEPNENKGLIWTSYDELGAIWFEDTFFLERTPTQLRVTSKSDSDISKRLLQILNVAKLLNPDFLNSNQGYSISTHQDFNRQWGLGTSSTLINNIANWAKVDAYKLLEKTFGGSGYDIACAQHQTPITFQLQSNKTPRVKAVQFNPIFKDHLYFVYLNKKQNSRDGIAAYRAHEAITSNIITAANCLTEIIITTQNFAAFKTAIQKHEAVIAQCINQEPIQSQLFKDFDGVVKSLGAWGGDFVLVISENNPSEYFKSKGFETIMPYADMVL